MSDDEIDFNSNLALNEHLWIFLVYNLIFRGLYWLLSDENHLLLYSGHGTMIMETKQRHLDLYFSKIQCPGPCIKHKITENAIFSNPVVFFSQNVKQLNSEHRHKIGEPNMLQLDIYLNKNYILGPV